jgi:Ca-activated chloride channel family protein
MRRIKSALRVLGFWTLLFLCAASPVRASNGPAPGDVQAGSLLMKMAQGYGTATLLSTDVNITVNGLVARVSVIQEFSNESGEWVEGVYAFPLPDGAAVYRMRLYVGDRVIEGEIREKEEARREYAAAKEAGKKTSLVEQQRANIFTTSVANIAPAETVVVEIEYHEDVRYDAGTYSLRFPMTLTPRYIPGQALPDRTGSGWSPDTTLVDDASLITPPMVTASRGHKASISATVNAGMPLEIIASRYHPVNIGETGGRYVVTLAGSRIPMDHDFELLWRPVPAAAPRAMIFSETVDGQPYYLLMVVPPVGGEAAAAQVPREMIFIIDTSGSMHGVSIEQARQALRRALDTLRLGDRFNVVEFNSHTNALYPASAAATAANVAEARQFVGRLDANGGTEMYPALQFALQSPAQESYLRQIVFITDGAVGNEEGLFQLIDQQLQGARLFTVGIGSAPNSWFMRKAAEAGRGTFTIISALHEVGEKMDRLFRKLESPQVTNIDVQWPGSTLVDSYPAVVPDLYLGEPVAVRARAATPFRTGEAVRIVGDSPGGAWSAELALETEHDSPGVGALWARARIADLRDWLRRGGDADEIRQLIVETALRHHLVSKFTSLVAVDKTPARPAGDPLSSEQVPNQLPYGQDASVIFGFPATATNAPLLRLVGAVLVLAALLLLLPPGAVSRRHGPAA